MGRALTDGRILLEACVDSVDSALAAQEGGAGRIELCDDLLEGGTTPSAGMIAACKERLEIPVFVMIRPRGGDFLYSDSELDVMKRDVTIARDLGADGVVFGLLLSDGSVDTERTAELVQAAGPMAVTFHRAFDVSRDAAEALEALIELGIDRVLTSGQAPSVPQGIRVISRLVEQARGRIGILPGGGVEELSVQRVVVATGVREVHVRGTTVLPSPMDYRNPGIDFGGRATAPADDSREVTDPARIRHMVEILRRQD